MEGHAVEEQPAVPRLAVLLLSVGVEGSGEGAAAAEEALGEGEEGAGRSAPQVNVFSPAGAKVSFNKPLANSRELVLLTSYGSEPAALLIKAPGDSASFDLSKCDSALCHGAVRFVMLSCCFG